MGDLLRFPARPSRAPILAEHRAALEHALERVLDAADHLVAQLDAMDGDPDLEEGGDAEPDLGAPAGGDSQRVWAAGSDRELDRSLSPESRP